MGLVGALRPVGLRRRLPWALGSSKAKAIFIREAPERMHQADLLNNWARQKTSCNFQHLTAPVEVEYEFRGRLGHPSSYAYVKLKAEPSESLSFSASVAWPTEFDAEYKRRIYDTIAEAIVDGLLARESEYPYRGCALQLVEFKWDSTGGSELAVQRATSKALELLRANGIWQLSTGHYRQYILRDGT